MNVCAPVKVQPGKRTWDPRIRSWVWTILPEVVDEQGKALPDPDGICPGGYMDVGDDE